jgi:hypothetical protein
VDFPPTTLFHWIRRRKLAFNLSITSPEQEISAQQAAISKHLPNLGTFRSACFDLRVPNSITFADAARFYGMLF